jgi:hypothetical protein
VTAAAKVGDDDGGDSRDGRHDDGDPVFRAHLHIMLAERGGKVYRFTYTPAPGKVKESADGRSHETNGRFYSSQALDCIHLAWKCVTTSLCKAGR